MKFKAKPRVMVAGALLGDYDWLKELLDEDGYIHGWYVDGYIVGKMLEVNEEYCDLEFCCPIDKSTLAAIGGNDESLDN